MAKEFDPKQKLVLESTSQNQLVSAGAGSGKTTVMIKKISDLIVLGQARPSEMIVLTFTNLAASEMKQRLISELNNRLKSATSEEEISNLISLISETETSAIDTIDGFCSKMIKKYFFKLNLSPDTNIATGLSLEYYINKALDNCLATALEINHDKVVELADCFEKNMRNLDDLRTNLLSTFNFIMAQKDYESFLALSRNEYTGLHCSAEYLNDYLISTLKTHLTNIQYHINDLASYENYFNSVKNYLEQISKITKDNNLLQNTKLFNSLPEIARVYKVKDEDRYSYEIVKNAINKIKKVIEEFSFISYFNQEYIENNSELFLTFVDLLEQFISCYLQLKQENKVLDFTDLERCFLSLLDDADIKADLDEQYKYIFVDEYQDINPMQDAIITKLKNENSKVFFVGDVKQSIYGFRQSTPELFLNLYKDYKTSSNSSVFDMNINFRSNPKILEFNNEIFSHLMTETKTDINYEKDAQFEPKRTDFNSTSNDIEIAVFNSENTNDEYEYNTIYSVQHHLNTPKNLASTHQAKFVADKIKSLVGTTFYDSNEKINRTMEYRDIAILSRSINDAKTQLLIKYLNEYSIPINLTSKVDLKSSEVINIIYQMLKVIANIGDDVAYFTYFTSPLVSITFDEMFQITQNKSQKTLLDKVNAYHENNNNETTDKIKYAFNLITELRLNCSCLNNTEIIDMLLNKYHLKQYILNSENGLAEFNTLQNFLNTLSTKENELSLEQFLSYLKTNMSSKTEFSQTDSTNSVTIQTIHASKGLEYPVVILFNSSKTFKPNNDRDDINFDTELGIGMQYFNLVDRTKVDSLPKFAIKLKNKIKAYKEELRLLYVATTRPKNKLIITGEISFKNIIENKLKDNNYIELIYSVYYNKLFNLDPKVELKNCTFYQFDSYISPINNQDVIEHYKSFKINSNNIDFDYKNKELSNISLKNNVTAISKSINEDFNILPDKLYVKENLHANIESSAEIGTTYHKALSELNFNGSYDYANPYNLDEKLLKIAHNKISDLCKNCKTMHNEAQFMMYVPYSEIYKDSQITKKILVQGVVDLMIEFEDHFVLVDFKYSKLNINSLKSRYSNQLNLYKLAIEKAYHKPVTASYIYHINTGDIL